MTDFENQSTESEAQIVVDENKKLLPYQKPLLQNLGDLRTFTLGPTPGVGESANVLLLKA
jgi:hypothetical protein